MIYISKLYRYIYILYYDYIGVHLGTLDITKYTFDY